jgi:hypothetical protein
MPAKGQKGKGGKGKADLPAPGKGKGTPAAKGAAGREGKARLLGSASTVIDAEVVSFDSPVNRQPKARRKTTWPDSSSPALRMSTNRDASNSAAVGDQAPVERLVRPQSQEPITASAAPSLFQPITSSTQVQRRYVFIYIYTCLCLYMFIHVYTHLCTCIIIYTCVHMYITYIFMLCVHCTCTHTLCTCHMHMHVSTGTEEVSVDLSNAAGNEGDRRESLLGGGPFPVEQVAHFEAYRKSGVWTA